KLTPRGKLFLEKAKSLLSAYNNLNFSENANIVFGSQRVSIGCHSTVAAYFVSKALTYLKNFAPDFNISLIHDLSRNIQNDIQKGNIDIGVVVNAVQVPDLVITKISQDTVSVWSNGKALDTIICNTELFQTQSI